MFVFGHIGIGRRLAQPWSHRLPAIPLIIGTLLPDLIDKPLYYARIWSYVSCTRTFGHTGIFLVGLAAAAVIARSRVVGALAVGVATHLLLDGLMSAFGQEPQDSAWMALTWPFLHRTFAHHTFTTISSHLRSLFVTPIIATEIVGLVLIGLELRAKWAGRGTTP
ncbi:MAG: metal-dependent hydrolase [Vicinamibacterales bacterium]